MYKYFLDNYKEKSKDDLLGIMASQQVQHKDAVKAAAKLLEEKFNHKTVIKARRKQRIYTEPYFKTFSKREIISALTSSFLFVAVISILVYMASVEFIGDNAGVLVTVSYIAVVILNHVFYRKEHKRSNRYIGRLMQTSMLTVFIFLIAVIINAFVNDNDLNIYGDEWYYVFIGTVMILFFLEFVISMLKWAVRLIRWQI